MGVVSIGRNGAIGFVGRESNTHGLDLAYLDNPSAGDSQAHLVDTLPSGQVFGSATLVDSSGRLLVVQHDGPTTSWPGAVYRRDGDSWTRLFETGTGQTLLRDIAPDDRFVYTVGQTGSSIYRSDLATPVYTLPSGESAVAVGIADNGAIAFASTNRAIYVSPSGDAVDLGALAGPGNAPYGALSINANGVVAWLTSDATNRKLFTFDGTDLELIADGLPLVPTANSFDPLILLTSSDELYFFGRTGSFPNFGLNLYRMQIPEPGNAGAILSFLILVVPCVRPRRTNSIRRRWSYIKSRNKIQLTEQGEGF